MLSKTNFSVHVYLKDIHYKKLTADVKIPYNNK